MSGAHARQRRERSDAGKGAGARKQGVEARRGVRVTRCDITSASRAISLKAPERVSRVSTHSLWLSFGLSGPVATTSPPSRC